MTTTIDLTPREAVEDDESKVLEAAERYVLLKSLCFVDTKTGERLTVAEMDAELDRLKAIIKPHIERRGDINIEGVGALWLQPKDGGWSWDMKSMKESDPRLHDRCVELGATTLSTKVAEALEAAGQLTGFKRFGFKGAGTPSLQIRKPRKK